MKKKMTFLAALLLALCACAGAQSMSPENDATEAPSTPTLEAPFVPLEHNGVTLHFVKPDESYDILGITTFDKGYAVVYQQEMPDAFNKIYSRDDIFYNISTQLFDAGGYYLTTVDSQWHNAIKITEPLLRLTPHSDTITFEIWRENEAGQTEAGCFMLAITEAGQKALGENPNHYLYGYRLFNELTVDGETQLQYTTAYDHIQGLELLKFRLAAPTGGVEELTMPMFDASFLNALHNTAHGVNEEDWVNDQKNPLYVLDASLDARAKTAVLSNKKTSCRLNFGGTHPDYSVTRSYTEAMLGERLVISPDGLYQLYTADARNYFEAPGGCDYVVRGPQGIVFLYAGSELDQLYFLDDDRIFANTFDTLRFYDAATGEVLSPGPQFNFGTQQNPYNKSMSGPVRIVVGTAIDKANRTLLVAHRPYTFGSGVLWQGAAQQTEALPVTLTALDWDGHALGEYNTGMTMRAFNKFMINVLSIKTNGDGTADLSWTEGPPVRVRYQSEATDVPTETQEVLS